MALQGEYKILSIHMKITLGPQVLERYLRLVIWILTARIEQGFLERWVTSNHSQN